MLVLCIFRMHVLCCATAAHEQQDAPWGQESSFSERLHLEAFWATLGLAFFSFELRVCSQYAKSPKAERMIRTRSSCAVGAYSDEWMMHQFGGDTGDSCYPANRARTGT
jgi:cobalamin synthase